MVRQPVDSSAISSIGFDPISRTLETEFRRGQRVYRFFGVPELLFRGLLAAKSKGHFVATRITDRYMSRNNRLNVEGVEAPR